METVVNLLVALTIAAIAVVPMAFGGAPFWACWGIGCTVWLVSQVESRQTAMGRRLGLWRR